MTVTSAPVPFKIFALKFFLVTAVVSILAGALFGYMGDSYSLLFMRLTALCTMLQAMRYMRQRGSFFGSRVLFAVAAWALCSLLMYGTRLVLFPNGNHLNDGMSENVAGPR